MGKFHEDLVAALSAISNPDLDGKANYGRYTTLPTCLNVARSILSQHNLALIQVVLPDPDRLVTRIIHSSGEYIEDGGVNLIYNKNNSQSMGSGITYARRYGLCSLLGIAGQQDDDGIMSTRFEDLPDKQQTPEQKEKHEKMEEKTIDPEPESVSTNKGVDDPLDPESIRENLHTFLGSIGAYNADSINDMGKDDAIEAKDNLEKYWLDNEHLRISLKGSDKQSHKDTYNWLKEKVTKTGTSLKSRIKAIEESEK